MMFGVVVWNTDVTKQWNIKTKLSWVKIEYFVFKYTKKLNKKYIEWNWKPREKKNRSGMKDAINE